jgi:hypothetical protein
MCESYQEQLQRLSRALARGDCASILEDVQYGCPQERVKWFVAGNVEKRLDKLADQLEFVAEAFDDFERLIEAYVHDQPLSAYDPGASDGERMLVWLLDRRVLTPVQRDYVFCQRARHAVEESARCHRAAHVQFQRRWSADRLRSRFDASAAVLHANPIRANTTFVTPALLDNSAEPPTEVLFFPVGHEIATAVLEPDVLRALEQLAWLGPTSLDQWAASIGCGDLGALAGIARQLQGVGLLAAD